MTDVQTGMQQTIAEQENKAASRLYACLALAALAVLHKEELVTVGLDLGGPWNPKASWPQRCYMLSWTFDASPTSAPRSLGPSSESSLPSDLHHLSRLLKTLSSCSRITAGMRQRVLGA